MDTNPERSNYYRRKIKNMFFIVFPAGITLYNSIPKIVGSLNFVQTFYRCKKPHI